MDNPTTQMPEKNEMLRRLTTVKDDTYLAQYFYPYILDVAGRRITGDGVVRAVVLAWENAKRVTIL